MTARARPASSAAGSAEDGFSVWRICKAAHAAFDGEGARIYGGRWNSPGTAVVYTSAHLSLAALEYFVNTDSDLTPDDLVSVRAWIPAGSPIEKIDPDSLPANWRSAPAPVHLTLLGDAWVRKGSSLLLSVPSAVIPEERNLLVNPAHGDAGRIQLDAPQPFFFDPRMRK